MESLMKKQREIYIKKTELLNNQITAISEERDYARKRIDRPSVN